MISIIVPLYNTEKYISQCLNSIVEQTYTDFECIIVNDGSTDNSFEIAKSIIENDSRFKIVTKENGGISSTRNYGIQLSTGDYIVFIDADDWIEPCTLEKFNDAVRETNADVVICDYFCNSSSFEEKREALLDKGGYYSDTNYQNSILCTIIGPHGIQLKHPERSDRLTSVWAKMYKASIIKNNSIEYVDLNKVPSECQLFNIEVLLKSNTAYYIKEALYHYRRNTASSLTKKYRKDLFQAWIYYLNLTHKLLEKRMICSDIYEAYINSIIFSVIQLGGNAVKQPNFRSSICDIRSFLNDNLYIDAFSKFKFKYLPIHWKVFFMTAKLKNVLFFFLITKSMRWLMNRKKK